MNKSVEHIYDTYSTMLFSIAVEISPTAKDAEEILIGTFKKIHQQNLFPFIDPSLCFSLIKLLIQTAREQLKPEELTHNFKLKQFENTPLLHKILCEQGNLESHGRENNLSRTEVGKMIRDEFFSLYPIENLSSPYV